MKLKLALALFALIGPASFGWASQIEHCAFKASILEGSASDSSAEMKVRIDAVAFEFLDSYVDCRQFVLQEHTIRLANPTEVSDYWLQVGSLLALEYFYSYDGDGMPPDVSWKFLGSIRERPAAQPK